MRSSVLVLAFALCFVGITGDATAAKITVSDDAYLDIHGYTQFWLYAPIEHNEGDPAITTDFYMRRVRFLFSGQVAKNVNFFVGTLNADMGKNGDMSARTLIADAWVEFTVNKYLKVDAGLLKLPFSRHMQQTGAKLHGLDFHGTCLQRCGGIGHRDMGIMVRGLLSESRVDYRFAILDGVEYAPGEPPDPDTNENDAPRFVGRLGYNLADPEPGYFWAGTYLGQKDVRTLGFSFDVQPGVGGDEGDELYYAIALDAFFDVPMEENAIVSTMNFYYFGPGGALPEGYGLWADFGYRVRKIEPLIAFDWYAPDKGDTGRLQTITGGLNWWMHGHNANLKFEFGAKKVDGGDEWIKTAIVQAQMLF